MKSRSQEEPRRILRVLEQYGDEHAWIKKTEMDWGEGKKGEAFLAGLPDGVHILALTSKEKILLVRQFRVNGLGWTLELPGGAIENLESPEEAVLRELEEETGYTAEVLEPLITYWPNPVLESQNHLFFATGLKRVANPRKDSNEHDLSVVEVTPTQLWEMIWDGTIRDGHTIITTLLAINKGIITPKKDEPEETPI